MLTRLGRFAVRRSRWILLATLVAVIAAAAYGGSVAERLTGGGFSDPNAESIIANEELEEVFDTGSPNLLLLVFADEPVDSPAVARAGTKLTEDIAAEPGVAEVASYWSLGNPPPLRSSDGSKALVLARLEGDEDEVIDRAGAISEKYTVSEGPIRVGVGGQAELFRQVGEQIEKDLARAEMITLPVTLILLIFVFGSVVAAGMPLGVGVISVLGTFAVLRALVSLTDVSIYALNLTTMMGLGLGIDYSLFIVSRYREELQRGKEVGDAIVRTVETAGRTVLYSALTVGISLVALMVFPLVFLRSFAYAGIAVVVLMALASLVFLPALLATVGTRIDRWVLWRRRAPEAHSGGFWHRMATFVMKRPLPIATIVIALLLFLGTPFLNVNFGRPDDRVLPATASTRQVHDEIRQSFSSQEANALSVVAADAGTPSGLQGQIDSYAARLSQIRGVARVDAVTGSYSRGAQIAPPNPFSERFGAESGTWLSVVPEVEPVSSEGEELVRDIRAAEAPFDVKVTGASADLVDSKEALISRLPLAGILIAVVTFVVLFLMSGSLLVPAKAVVLNLLSLTATFGAMVWIFQEGHFSGFLNFTPTGMIDTTNPILMFCVAFGLSMDYEVFLLSRIKEEHDRSGDNIASVAWGLEKTGRIVTAAAGLMAVVFIAFATSEITFIKLIGIGLALAVIMDATLIRATLVPAFMRLAGEANWWAPKPLKRIYERFGLKEAPSEEDAGHTSPAPVPSDARA